MTTYLALGPCAPRCIAPRGEHVPDERCTPAAAMRKGDTVSAGAPSILLADPTPDPENEGWVILAFDTCEPRSYPAGEVFQIRRPAPQRLAPALPEGTRRFRVHSADGGPAVDCHLWPCGKLTMDMFGQRLRSGFSLDEMLERNWENARIEWEPEGPAPQDQPLPPTGPLALFDVSEHTDTGRPDGVRITG
ncbi:hypothetical protein [Kitasatospora sp. NPDC058046]|uniref:hypothetical protein n=1 Tax=Kitasatospora sp. NPDC058046 TaxID=3346312 RepID=UPI0036D81347